jgi:hypothetical protein
MGRYGYVEIWICSDLIKTIYNKLWCFDNGFEFRFRGKYHTYILFFGSSSNDITFIDENVGFCGFWPIEIVYLH